MSRFVGMTDHDKEWRLSEFLGQHLDVTEYHRAREVVVKCGTKTKRYPMGQVPSNEELYLEFFGDYIDTDSAILIMQALKDLD